MTVFVVTCTPPPLAWSEVQYNTVITRSHYSGQFLIRFIYPAACHSKGHTVMVDVVVVGLWVNRYRLFVLLTHTHTHTHIFIG